MHRRCVAYKDDSLSTAIYREDGALPPSPPFLCMNQPGNSVSFGMPFWNARAAESFGTRARGGDAALFAPPASAPKKLRVCSHQSSSSSENAFAPVEGSFPRLSLLSSSPNIVIFVEVSSFLTAGCITRIEMRGGRFAVKNQGNQRLPSLDDRHWLRLPMHR